MVRNTGLNGQGAGPDPENLVPMITQLCQLRANLLGTPYGIISARIATYLNDDATKAARNVFLMKAAFVQSPTCGTGPAEPADVALIAKGKNTTRTAFNDTLLGAPADAAVSDGGLVNGTVAGLAGNFNAWAGFLIANQFGWGLSETSLNLKIVSIAQDVASGSPILTLPPGSVAGLVPNTFYPARIRGVNNRRSTLNGQCNVFAPNANSVQLQEVVGLGVPQAGGFIRIYKPLRPFTQYGFLNLSFEVGNHRRGRPPGSPRGRAPARIRG